MSEQPLVRHASADRFMLLLPTFVLTTLLSSSLLFFVQPLMARLTLPLLGGSPSVWAVTMCFFQAMLLAGYAYAHLLIKLLPVRSGIILHVVMMAIAAVALTFDVATAAENFASTSESTQLLLVLLTTIGLPFAVMSANAPLLQSWFSHSGHKDAHEPYFLYGASNLGSMSSLFLYPAIVEPFVGLSGQTALWAKAFSMLVFAISACGGLTAFHRVQTQVKSTAVAPSSISWTQRGYWLLMAFLPSAMLMAWTNHITTEVAAAPFLWLPPLVLYLFSFIAVFREKSMVSQRVLRLSLIMAAPAAFVLLKGTSTILLVPVLALGAIVFVATTFLCHRNMYDTRPAPAHLTEFYLLMSLGGVLGGLFVSLAAPRLFVDVSEYPLLLALALVLLSSTKTPMTQHRWITAFVFAGIAATAHTLGTVLGLPSFTGVNAVFIALFLAAAFAFAKTEQKTLMAVSILLLIVQVGERQHPVMYKARNFFGVLTIKPIDDYVVMLHGTTLHGATLKKDAGPAVQEKPQLLTYYAEKGGIGRSILTTQNALKATGEHGTFGVVGLGAGLLACYAQPNETWRFFEINPDVVHAARDMGTFNFMQKCQPNAPVIIGDARLKLKAEAQGSYDNLIIDAFSSDSVPVHLMTTEAMQLYLSLLKDKGVLVFHISNRHMELKSVLAANVEALRRQGMDLQARYVFHRPANETLADTTSEVVIISRDAASLGLLGDQTEVTALEANANVEAWTDDYSNILGAIARKLW